LVLSLGFVANLSLAQDFPSKPIRLLVGFPPGGNADVGARIVAQKMSEGFGRQVLVENRAGAGGVVANAIVAKPATLHAPGDRGFVTQAATMKKLPYDSMRTPPISLLIVIRSSSPSARTHSTASPI
jgi:tripartite-type tricarboxylate transporter receptor subunit TctC